MQIEVQAWMWFIPGGITFILCIMMLSLDFIDHGEIEKEEDQELNEEKTNWIERF